ncbi:MAG: helix-turn-helix domain-containing protein [Candidatus Heimdallarchaeaceae archaeon]
MIIRSNKEKWVTADTCWVKDSTLSAKAKGILIYLLSLPDDWDLHVTELVTHFTDGEKSIRTGIKELEKHGYVFCIPRKDEVGKFIGNDYVIMEDPRSELPHTQKRNTAKGALLNTNNIPNTNKTIIDLTKYESPIKILNKLTGRNFKIDRKNLGKVKARGSL